MLFWRSTFSGWFVCLIVLNCSHHRNIITLKKHRWEVFSLLTLVQTGYSLQPLLIPVFTMFTVVTRWCIFHLRYYHHTSESSTAPTDFSGNHSYYPSFFSTRDVPCCFGDSYWKKCRQEYMIFGVFITPTLQTCYEDRIMNLWWLFCHAILALLKCFPSKKSPM